ncbi:MAG: lipopolysaccharide transport periplasmic protein LptA [Burkholderiales bacterium]|nr:lipopolysaccharide transport periplasmic protein LptA [Burkholderiales bacterium]
MQSLIPSLFAVLALVGVAIPAHAELADRDQPIAVDAATGESNGKTNTRTLDGDVHLNQGTLSIMADHAIMQANAEGDQHVTANGRPVKFRQKMEASPDWLDAKADKLEYDSKSGDVRLLGNAWLKRGGDEINGSVVTYNTNTEIYRAEGGKRSAAEGVPASGDRVHMIIQPKKKTDTAAKPADAQAKPAEGQNKP